MRMRRKPWARPELAACSFFIDEPKELKGKWRESFAHEQPLYVELGCGKGGFVAQAALLHPEINFLAVDIKSEVLAVGRRTIVKKFAEENRTVDNILLTAFNIEQINEILDSKDDVERIYINFCNPWPRMKHKKRRLTHTRQLEKYKEFLRDGARIYFKTDDDGLYEESLDYLKESGFEIIANGNDLHASGIDENIVTEHEKMFTEQGIKIKYCIAEFNRHSQEN